MRLYRSTALAASVVLLGAALSACSSGGSSTSSGSGDTVNVGMSSTLSGPVAALGTAALHGVELAAADINAKGGLLGKKINIVSADGLAQPATGAQNVRNMITKNHAVALMGPVASSVATAEEQVAAQYKTPIFFLASNDSSLVTKTFTPYAFQNVPSTIMEPRAIADYLAKKVGSQKITIGTFAPDYSFGHDSVDSFLQALKALHVNFTLVKQEFPALGASNISSNLSALIAARPQYVYNAQYGGDLVSFTKQAEQFGFFKHTTVIAMWSATDLKALGGNAPTGAIAFNRAAWSAIDTPAMNDFVKAYQAKYNELPDTWSVLGYSALQEWAYGVQQAGSFQADKVIKVLPGATVPMILGPTKIRACDHMSELGEYVGTISQTGDSQYGGVHLYDLPMFKAPFVDIALTCQEAQGMQPS
jgi:branched-chain amino acid transport system substrate-binding protein